MRSVGLRNFKINLKSSSKRLARGREEWESAKSYPYVPVDDHEPPKDEDIIKEIFDKNYYHFHNKAKIADSHEVEDQFFKLRQWQHLYIHPK